MTYDSDDSYHSARYLAKLRRRVDQIEAREQTDDLPNPVRVVEETGALDDAVTTTVETATRGVWDTTGWDDAATGDADANRVWGP